MSLSEDLDRLDLSIRQLQAKWDLFFSGVEKKPPAELQAQVEAAVKRYGTQEMRNSGDRFRCQTLTARFTTFSELWQKRLRAREEGKVFGMHGLRAEQSVSAPSPRPAAATQPARADTGEVRVADARRDATAIRTLYDRLLAERRRAGETTGPDFESFRQLIAQQTDRIRGQMGATAVDFRLETKDGKVSLKARVVK